MMMTETIAALSRRADAMDDTHVRWGASMLARLDAGSIATILDAGCGSGRVTEVLVDHLPDARVVGLASSSERLEAAAMRLAGPMRDGRVELVHADLTRPLPIEPVDAVLSTATLHWIADHDTVFGNLAAVLRTDGQLVAQCGGGGSPPTDLGEGGGGGGGGGGLPHLPPPAGTR